MADAPSTRELQELVNDPRWPHYRAYLEELIGEHTKRMLRHKQPHEEMTRAAGAIEALGQALAPGVAEETNPSPRSER